MSTYISIRQGVLLAICLEGSTERSDGNRGRSPRISAKCTMCLEGTTPQDLHYKHRHRRSAFQAPRSRIDHPRTSSPVTIATLCSAFQARTLNVYERLCLSSTNVRFQQTIYRQVVRLSYKHLFLRPRWEARFEHHYSQDSFHYPQDNFSFPIRDFLLQTL